MPSPGRFGLNRERRAGDRTGSCCVLAATPGEVFVRDRADRTERGRRPSSVIGAAALIRGACRHGAGADGLEAAWTSAGSPCCPGGAGAAGGDPPWKQRGSAEMGSECSSL
ncbi:hypothetical protein NDU88_010277 [Pleurodeles waltl]|uniref:Uncharacterized protein n=1 Tax=Pleurodeles waltl TaxID=8319 RepID=A0AAV7R000_PLEWA|nr:hypothetical protein NDU88_010277 [Pleurodeles waltl]